MRHTLNIILLILLSVTSVAQQYAYINYNVDEGLAQSQAMVLHQDRKGYLWVGTVSGLSRFDGTDFVNFSKSDGLLDDQISSMAEDPGGRLYLGCLGGFSEWDGSKFRSRYLPPELEEYKVTAINWLYGDRLWLGTDGAGYLIYDRSRGTFSEPSLASGSYINWLSPEEPAFVGSDRGFFLDDELVAEVLDGISVTDAVISDGKIYLSTSSQGFFVIGEEWHRYTTEDGLVSDRIRHFTLAADGSCWLATRQGVNRFVDGRISSFTEANGLPYNNIRDVIQDDEGNLWFASNGQGLFRFTGDTFETFKEGKELISDKVMSILEKEGVLLLGTFDKGLQAYSREQGAGMVEGVPSTDVWTLLQAADGRLWAGTSTGLYVVDGPEVERFSTKTGMGSNRITALHQDNGGLIWVGHRSGLSVYNGQEFRDFGEEVGFTGKRVRSICEGSDGGLWFGAENGLFSYSPEGEVTQYTEADGLADNTVYSLRCDKEDRLWIGTKNGLDLLDGGQIRSLRIAERFNANNINFLEVTARDQLLIGTNNGLYRLDLRQVELDAPTFIHYGLSEGLPGLECNLNSVYQDAGGQIWFGTNKGLVSCAERDLLRRELPRVPPAQINDIRLFGDTFDVAAHSDSIDAATGLPVGLRLEHRENHLTFDFSSVAFRHPEDLAYSYYLEGVDDDWLPPSNISTVSYSALKPGQYVFRIRTFDSEGHSAPRLTSLSFEILPPFWLTWWFITFEILILLLVAYGIWKWWRSVAERKRRTRELDMRTKMFSLEQQSLNSSMNRHFIFNALNSIQFYINHEDKRSANRYLSSFAKLIRKNLDSTSSTWVTLKDELERLDLYLSLEHMRYQHRFDYRIEVAEGLNAAGVRIPAMMLQPFLENSIWHGILHKEGHGLVSVRVAREEDTVRITIEDDGIGVDASLALKKKEKSGHQSRGMEITNDRIQLYRKMTNGEFEIIGPYQIEENGTVLGTKVEIILPYLPLSEVRQMQEKGFV